METLLIMMKVFSLSALGAVGIYGGIIAGQKLWGPIRIVFSGGVNVENHFHAITSEHVAIDEKIVERSR